jgi:cell division protein FtsI/penicillin-binding protein 2
MIYFNKFKVIPILFAGLLYTSGTIFNICQGKYVQKVNADEGVEVRPARNPAESAFLNGTDWPSEVSVGNKKVRVEYNFDNELTDYTKKLLSRYRSDYTTITIIDNKTGKVLTAVGYQGKNNQFDKNLILSSTHPSASLIKVVTAAELIQNTSVKKDTMFDFRGRSTTLFKYQLNDSKGRAGRSQSFETAFAKSNNVIFGKAAISNSSSEKLVKMAENFGFNQPVLKEFSFLRSEIKPTIDDYSFAELASGFNIETRISPVHAASLASIVANDGILKTPKLISKLVDQKTGEVVWQESNEEKQAIAITTARELKDLMSSTIEGGTARRSFRPMRSGYKNSLEIGGKTGHITGGVPFGKRDWFTAYAIPKDKSEGSGISISVMNINVKRWHVKSAVLAKSIIEHYFKKVQPIVMVDTKEEYKRKPSSISKKRALQNKKRSKLQMKKNSRKHRV